MNHTDLIKYLIDHGAIKFNNINNKNSVNISNHNKTNVNVKDVGRKTTVYHAPGGNTELIQIVMIFYINIDEFIPDLLIFVDHTDAEIDVNSNATTKPVEYALYWSNFIHLTCID